MGKKPTKKKQQKTQQTEASNRELLLKGPGLEYAQASKMLGDGRLEIICFDGKTRLGHIRGKIHKRVWISPGDILLVALRDFQDDKADIINKYSADEVRQLKTLGEIPNTKTTNQIKFDDDSDDNLEVVFSEL